MHACMPLHSTPCHPAPLHSVPLGCLLRCTCRSLPCYDFMYCTPAEGPVFKDFAKLERLETL